MQYNIYITGVGGQGVVKTSIVIGQACIKQGLNVVTSEIHGMSQRGGVVPVEVRIGDVNGPIIKNGSVDLLLSFEPLEAVRALPKLNENTVAVVNTEEIVPFTASLGISKYLSSKEYIDELKKYLKVVIPVNAEAIAKEIHDSIVSNMVILGVGASVPNFPIEKEYVIDAIKESFKPQYVNLNIKAFERGYELGKEYFK
ncbi:indolepyruvate oxidoreductase subunit beta [Caldisericum exile]|uniref:Indolepyruvate ferredoxin oxidoreductase beta subunit n=1 Tax=Caldisericum exile (strain DSM 21853 / NBRC 104410 / AZM16c01) TaxID=511051 RepID=A0A7U6JFD8_CALEA|nr:indolepyruvate oxidoreductase subunit beta [Caldisericum exile]BAL81681.1 putative indolepyruvate ferredoxin oxidoreductase beta subunit [Caldisericum exile AZM16c01]